jgi:hypothetical protein
MRKVILIAVFVASIVMIPDQISAQLQSEPPSPPLQITFAPRPVRAGIPIQITAKSVRADTYIFTITRIEDTGAETPLATLTITEGNQAYYVFSSKGYYHIVVTALIQGDVLESEIQLRVLHRPHGITPQWH